MGCWLISHDWTVHVGLAHVFSHVNKKPRSPTFHGGRIPNFSHCFFFPGWQKKQVDYFGSFRKNVLGRFGSHTSHGKYQGVINHHGISPPSNHHHLGNIFLFTFFQASDLRKSKKMVVNLLDDNPYLQIKNLLVF